MIPNVLVLAGCALIPFLFAMVWFHKSLFGGTNWHDITEMPDSKKTPVKPIKLVLSLLLNFMLAFGVYLLTIHESGIFGMLEGDIDAIKTGTAAAFLAEHGGHFHTWTHGLTHGLSATLLFAFPMIGYLAIFEKKSAKYFWVYIGYWYICLSLMAMAIAMWGAMPV